jgi:hypothetical protein
MGIVWLKETKSSKQSSSLLCAFEYPPFLIIKEENSRRGEIQRVNKNFIRRDAAK